MISPRISPHSSDSEQALLCSFLIDPQQVGALCVDYGITDQHFHLPEHNLFFRGLHEMWTQNLPIDVITVTQWFRDRGELSLVNGPAFISQIFTLLPTHANALRYIEILEEQRILREIYKTSNEFLDRSQNDQAEPHALLEEFSSRAMKIASVKESAVVWTPKMLAQDAAERAEDRFNKKGLSDRTVVTGFTKLDAAMSGIPAGSYVLISGKEKSGKTTLAFNIFEHVVFTQRKYTLVISMEMKVQELTDRLISSMGRIPLTNILNGWFSENDFTNFTKTASTIAGASFRVRDDVSTLAQVVAAIRQEKFKHPELELVVIDYLQMIESEKSAKEEMREKIVASTSRTIRRIANELSIAIIILVQLNEGGNVRESRSVGMDCTSHLRLEDMDENEEGKRWLRVVYQRNGPSNVGIPLSHLAHIVRFENYSGTDGEIPDPQKKRR